MKREIEIPVQDLKAINDSFKARPGEAIRRNEFGENLNAERVVTNEREYQISDFRGRKLKHQKSLVPVDGKQITIGVAGEMFDNVPLRLRNLVVWFESDFE